MNRPSWDEYFKKILLVTKSRSACERLQVGCLLVKNNRIIRPSADYTGPNNKDFVSIENR